MNITVFVNIKKETLLSKEATDEFVKRLRPYCNLRVVNSLKPEIPTTGDNVQNFCITPASKSGTKTISSEKFALYLQNLTVNGISNIHFYIGFTEPWIKDCIPFAVTSVTLDLPMSTIVLCEQIYRAYTINNHIAYHK